MNEKRWEQNYKDVCTYLSEHNCGLTEIPEDERGQSGTLLHRWIMDMWKAYNNRSKFRLNAEQREKLEALGIAQITTKTHKIWLSHLMKVKQYVDETRSFQIPDGYTDTDGTDLSSWLQLQRTDYRRGEMNPERIAAFREAELLEFLESPFERAYRHAEEYYRINGHLYVPYNYKSPDGFALGEWISAIRDKIKHGKASADYIPLLDKIGMVWDTRKYIWMQNYEACKNYFTEHGNLDFPDGMLSDIGQNLTNWLVRCRLQYRKHELTDEQEELLDKIGVFDCFAGSAPISTWQARCLDVKRFYDENGHTILPNDMESSFGINMRSWLISQRRKLLYGGFSEEEIAFLRENDIYELIEKPHEKTISQNWQARCLDVKRFYDENGHTTLPNDMESSFGINMRSWLVSQRRKLLRGGFSEEEIAFLRENDIYELIEKPHEETMPQNWQARCLELKKFYDANGHTTLPDNMESAHGINMRKWLVAQRRKLMRGGFSEEEIEFLLKNDIYKLIEEPHDAPRPKKEQQPKLKERYIYDVRWEKNAQLLKQFFDKHHHTQIPEDVLGENDVPLASWFAIQRHKLRNGKIAEERIAFLKELNILELFENPIIPGSSRSNPERERVWQEKCRQLKAYCDGHHTKNVPITVLTEAGTSLRRWYHVEKKKYRSGKLPQSRLDFLVAHDMMNLFQKYETIEIHLELPSDCYDKLSQITKHSKCKNQASAIEMLIEFYEKNH